MICRLQTPDSSNESLKLGHLFVECVASSDIKSIVVKSSKLMNLKGSQGAKIRYCAKNAGPGTSPSAGIGTGGGNGGGPGKPGPTSGAVLNT
jgi:hypothetical protein